MTLTGRFSRSRLAIVGALSATAVGLFLGSPASAASGSAGAARGGPVFPSCSWPLETTPTSANIAAPDPYATYWLTPFIAKRGYSLTISGTFPTTRFMSFTVYNDSLTYFTNTVRGQSVPSDLSDYQIGPDPGSTNPWRTGSTRGPLRYTVRLLPTVTAAMQRSENAIPTIDQTQPTDPSGPSGIGYVIFRVYIPSGGNTTVPLPTMTVTHNGRSTTLAQCARSAGSGLGSGLARIVAAAARLAGGGSGTAGGAGAGASSGATTRVPQLRYFGPSVDQKTGLFPNPANDYVSMNFTPRRGYVIVTHGEAPTSPVDAGSGQPGDSIGAYPVQWLRPAYQVRYWSIANYVNRFPDPVVKIGSGPNAIFGGTADYVTTLKDGYYTVVSSLPADKPSASSLTANGATWIPMSASNPRAPEYQLLRNMLSVQNLYPEGFAFITPPSNPDQIIPPATVRRFMGAYYPQTAECRVRVFEAGGWAGCLAASRGSA